jgi:hypothetical protein
VPLAPGNTWVLADTLWDPSGAIISAKIDTNAVLRDTMIAGETRYVLREPHVEYIATNRTDGYWHGRGPVLELLYKFPANIGDSAQSAEYYYMTTRVASTDSTVLTPSGSYRCYVYRTAGSLAGYRYVWNQYIAPNHGFIGSDSYRSYSDTTMLHLTTTTRLLAYQLH